MERTSDEDYGVEIRFKNSTHETSIGCGKSDEPRAFHLWDGKYGDNGQILKYYEWNMEILSTLTCTGLAKLEKGVNIGKSGSNGQKFIDFYTGSGNNYIRLEPEGANSGLIISSNFDNSNKSLRVII